VIAFFCRLLRGRFSTRTNLASQGVHVTSHDSLYVWCMENLESKDHLFAKCLFGDERSLACLSFDFMVDLES